MLVADVVFATWELLRWRRLKSTFLQARGAQCLKKFLASELSHDHCREKYEQSLAEILQEQNGLPEDEARVLAHQCALFDEEATSRLHGLLDKVDLNESTVLIYARVETAKGLVQQYTRQESKAVRLVNELLVSRGMTIESLIADALTANDNACLTSIDRIDQMACIAAARRSASLREIERHRATLGNVVRRAVQDVDDSDFQVIEALPATGKEAA